jgi:signal peptidase II
MANSYAEKKTAYPWLALSVAIFVLDQFTKGWVTGSFEFGDRIALIPHLNLVIMHNPGAAFSFLADAGGWQRGFFITVSSIISLGIIIWIMRMPRSKIWLAISLALVLGGALGNLWDRVEFGYVVDFIDFYYQTWHWPAFNVADIAISMGAVSLILESLFGKQNKSKTEPSSLIK